MKTYEKNSENPERIHWPLGDKRFPEVTPDSVRNILFVQLDGLMVDNRFKRNIIEANLVYTSSTKQTLTITVRDTNGEMTIRKFNQVNKVVCPGSIRVNSAIVVSCVVNDKPCEVEISFGGVLSIIVEEL